MLVWPSFVDCQKVFDALNRVSTEGITGNGLSAMLREMLSTAGAVGMLGLAAGFTALLFHRLQR